MPTLSHYEAWPELPYEQFKSTQYLLHRITQAMGKLKLSAPFDPHWASVALWPTSLGVTTGPIYYAKGSYAIDLDLISHQLVFTSSWGKRKNLKIESMSVAEFIGAFLGALSEINVIVSINLMPQEVPNPISFDKDTKKRQYEPALASAWLRILLSTYYVMQHYHSHFYGITPSIGLMWGTFDLRDARYKGVHVPTEGDNAGYIRRNAMDDAQVEAGWWSGNDQYPKPAYFSFIYPEPAGIANVNIKPSKARWDNTLREFILDYDDVRTSATPEADLLAFFESAYEREAEKAEWGKDFIVKGEPV